MVLLDGGIPRLKSLGRVERSPDGINNQMSMSKMSLQIGGHCFWFDLVKPQTMSSNLKPLTLNLFLIEYSENKITIFSSNI